MNKSTGQLALVSFLLAFGGASARLFTVLIETDDFNYAFQIGVAVVLNGSLFLQFLCYWGNSGKKVEKEDSGKKKQTKETKKTK